MSTPTAADVGLGASPPEPPATDRAAHERRVTRGIVLAVWLGIVVGFVVALRTLSSPRWFPILDLAQTEMRLRDVFTAHPPLLGLPGRIGNFAHQGSHPGPLNFWVLAVFYRVYGGSAWAMQAAAATVNAVALGTTLLIARRRGGRTLVLGVAAMLAVLTWFYGPSVLTQAWNPYLPMTWFVVFLFAVWSVGCDDLAMLPVAAFAACWCVQTHISYVGLVGGLTAVTLVWIGYGVWRKRPTLPPHVGRWVLFALGVVVVLWIPPVVQELRNDPGNLTLIWRHFTNPPEEPIGLKEGLRVFLVHLNPWRLVVSQDATTGSVLPGLAFLAVWAVGAIVAWRRGLTRLVRLDAVLLVALALGAYSVGSIFGYVWYYLMFWAWILTALMILTTAWVLVAVAERPPAVTAHRVSAVAAAVVTVVYLTGFALDARDVQPPTPRVSSTLGALARPTVRAIERGTVPGGGPDGRYQVTVVDPITINAPAYGLVSELERAGIRAGFPDNAAFRAIVRDQRIVPQADATAVVHYSVGKDIDVWKAKPGVVLVREVDPRSPAEKVEARHLRAEIIRRLRAGGRDDLVPTVDDNLFAATFQPGVPVDAQRLMLRLLDIGQPAAVFVGPARYAE
jgi:hypothetical protein